ncbi:MAG: hypothetical protein ISP41_11235 [Alphaproteobacteria bacterium]|jgi:hypothetical protein|nr:hypothetical protein [Alphaproteobacteria bacterium]
MLRQSLRALLVLALFTGTASAARANSEQQQAERKIEEGAKALLEGMQLLLKTIPWYGQPEMKPNGDIVIPRRDGPPLSAPRKQSPGSKDDDGETKRL